MDISPFLAGNFAPVVDERDDSDCPITGTLPAGLRGTLYRNGPNPQHAPVEPYHWFTGDGMIHAITLGEGRAGYRNRWVRTPRFEAEARARRALFAGFGQPLSSEANGVDTGVANTHVVPHAGRLLALEEAHRPTRLDAVGLDTLGFDDFGGTLTGPLATRFTAHPKTDPATGQLVFFSYSADGPFGRGMTWGEVEPDGRVSRHEAFEAPYCAMAHDFAVTTRHVAFPVLPLTGDLDRARSGRPPFAWDPTKPSYLGMLRRDQGVASLAWVEFAPCFVFHVLNAFDADGDVVIDVVEYDSAPLFPTVDGGPSGAGSSRLARWRVDGAGRGPLRREVLDSLPGEFPRIDERRAGLPYRLGFRVCPLPKGPGDVIVRHDLDRGVRDMYWPGDGARASEAVFVPAHPDAPEGEGWVLSVVYDPATASSSLVVLDATEFERGPLATVHLPRRVPFGFHGSWLAAA